MISRFWGTFGAPRYLWKAALHQTPVRHVSVDDDTYRVGGPNIRVIPATPPSELASEAPTYPVQQWFRHNIKLQ